MKRQGARERLMETASRLFYTQGYNQTGINQILEASSVAKASMYQHFRSKEDMAVEYLQRRHLMWMASLDRFVAQRKSGIDQIIASFDFLKEWMTEVDFIGCGFQNIITDLPANQQKIRDVVRMHKDELRAWIYQAMNNEKRSTLSEAKEIGDQVFILIEGSIISAQIHRSIWPVVAAQKAAISIMK